MLKETCIENSCISTWKYWKMPRFLFSYNWNEIWVELLCEDSKVGLGWTIFRGNTMAGRVPRASYPFKGSCNNESGGGVASIYSTLQQSSKSSWKLPKHSPVRKGEEQSDSHSERYAFDHCLRRWEIPIERVTATPAGQLLLTWLIPLVRTIHGKCVICMYRDWD